MSEAFSIRLAREDDIPALEVLIPLSVRVLQAPYYSSAQMEAALGPIFAVDRQLISDGTYFVVEHSGQIVGCGGWSRHSAVCGDGCAHPEDSALDPAHDPARIRAFFVHPDWARRGIGRSILSACESALCAAGFRDAILVATLAGEPLYASFGYSVAERYEIPLSGGLTLPAVRMVKSFNPNDLNAQQHIEPTTRYSVANVLSEAQAEQLHSLYQREWWTVGRSLADVRTMLQHSDFVFAIAAPETQELLAFARVLTDHVFKALVLDVIVHPDHRSVGLGSFLMAHMIAHPVLSRVRHIELYCLPERAEFYQRQGFTSELGELRLMRRGSA